MEVKLDRLIEKIKQDGVLEAKRQSEEIKEQARREAEQFMAAARKQAEEIVVKGRKEAEQSLENSRQAIRQAARDTILSLKDRIGEIFQRLLREDVSCQLDQQYIKDLIMKIVEKCSQEQRASWEVEVSPEDGKRLQQLLRDQLRQKLGESIEIRINPAIKKGFRIGIKDKNVYYDFSEESISEALTGFLNPYLAALISEK